MGTINYKTTDFVTIAVEPFAGFDEDYDFLLENCEEVIKDYDFDYFKVNILSGYYEGFQVEIVYNDAYIYTYEDNYNAFKEATKIKKMLKKLVSECGLSVTHPGWRPCYLNEKDSLKEINKAVKNIKQEIKITMTNYQFNQAFKKRA